MASAWVGSLLLVGVTVGAGQARAADANDVLSEVVVTGRYSASEQLTGTKIEAPIIEVPQSVAVVTDELIAERRPLTIVEALYNVSGVSDSGARRGFDNLIIRGFNASMSMYLDGLRVERGNWNVQQELFGLERLEVLKGPGSVLFGQGSLGGIVNQVSKRPGTEAAPAVEVMGGSYETYQVGVDSGSLFSGDSWSSRIVGLYRDLGDSIDFNDKQRVYLSPSAVWSNDSTQLVLLANVTRDRHDGSYVGVPLEGSLLPNVNGRLDRSLYIGEPANDELSVDRYQLGYQLEHRFESGWVARQNLRFTDTDVLSKATFSGGLNPDQRTLRRGTAIFDHADRSMAVDTHAQYRVVGDRFENTLLMGADLLFQEVDSSFDFGSFPPLDLYAPVYGAPRGPLAGIQDYTQDDDLYGLYLQNQLKLGERLTILSGVRYDVSETDSFNRLSNRSRDQRDSDFTFRAGVTYELTPGIAAFTSYSEAFNPNFGLNAFGEPFDPETGVQYEIGLKTDLRDGRIRSTLAFYQLTRDDVLVAFPQFPGAQIQTGRQRSQGVELDAAIDVTAALSLTVAYAHTDAEVRRDTNPAIVGDGLLNVPEQQLSAWSTYRIDLGGGLLSVGLGGRHVGDREGALPNAYRLPSYEVFDALVSYRWQGWLAQLNVFNVTDEEFIDSGSPTGQRSVLLGEPRTARITVGFSF